MVVIVTLAAIFLELTDQQTIHETITGAVGIEAADQIQEWSLSQWPAKILCWPHPWIAPMLIGATVFLFNCKNITTHFGKSKPNQANQAFGILLSCACSPLVWYYRLHSFYDLISPFYFLASAGDGITTKLEPSIIWCSIFSYYSIADHYHLTLCDDVNSCPMQKIKMAYVL